MKKSLTIISVLALAFFVGCMPESQEESSAESIDNSLTQEEKDGGILTPEVLWKFNRIGAAHLSPDGTEVLYTMTRYSVEKNTGRTHIYKVPVEGGDPVQLTSGEASCHTPEWLNGGKQIAYMSADDTGTQLWSMDADGENAKKRTEIEGGVNYVDVAPGGEKILFCQDVKMNELAEDKYPNLPEANVHIATDLMYRHWDHWDDGT
ncbi:MAG: TolB family protein, partial [Bacteroidota bacterium]